MNAIAQSSAAPASGPQLDNRRVLAGLIDLAIVVAGTVVIGFASGIYGGDAPAVSLPVAALMTAWALYYYFACESGGGQTLGKKLMRLRVVRVDGRPAEMGDIAVRTVVRILDMQFVYLVGLVTMLATGKRRGRLGDLAAGTMVVSADGPAAAAPPAAAPVAVAPGPETLTLAGRGPEAVGPEPVAPEPAPPAPEVVAPAEPVVEETVVALDDLADLDSHADDAGLGPAFPVEDLSELDRYADDAVVEPAFPVDDLAELDALEDEPVVEPAFPVEDFATPEPVVAPDPVPHPAPEAETPEPELVVRSVETVSAIDLVMGDDEPDRDEPGADPAVEPDQQ